MKKKLSILIIALILGLVIVSLYFLAHHKKTTIRKMPPTLVHVQAAKAHELPLTVSALGQVITPNTIMLKTKTAGDIAAIYFHEGDYVKKGQPLIRMNDVTQKANLAEKQADYNNLKTQYARYIKLQKQYPGAVSQDTISQTLDKMKAAKAEVEATQQTLHDTLIRAPFDGTIGRLQAAANTLSLGGQSQDQATQLAAGTYLPTGSPIAILSNTEHVLVQYQVPQIESALLKQGQTVTVSSAAFPNRTFKGNVTAISPVVYENSQTYEVIASIKNDKQDLRSGMKVFIKQVLMKEHKVLAIPGISLVPSLNGYSVYMIEKAKVKAVPVVIEQRFGKLVSIASGLKAGDKVITEGINKVQPGAHVTVAKS